MPIAGGRPEAFDLEDPESPDSSDDVVNRHSCGDAFLGLRSWPAPCDCRPAAHRVSSPSSRYCQPPCKLQTAAGMGTWLLGFVIFPAGCIVAWAEQAFACSGRRTVVPGFPSEAGPVSLLIAVTIAMSVWAGRSCVTSRQPIVIEAVHQRGTYAESAGMSPP